MSNIPNPSGMPRGTGSLQVRGRTWWMIYTDAEGRRIQENTYTTDKDEARRMLARTAANVMREIVAELERIANGEEPPARRDPRSPTRREVPPRRHRVSGVSDQRGKAKKGDQEK